ncbi:MAG TPA: right-handed parallel beta-helix repeat-containing protein [Puia sp.]
MSIGYFKMGYSAFFAIGALINSGEKSGRQPGQTSPSEYYFSASGNDQNDGSRDHPFNSISKLNGIHLQAGDAVYFHGGDTFDGSVLIDSSSKGTTASQIIISSYGKGKATIHGGNGKAFTVYETQYITVNNLNLKGSGRKGGNLKEGLAVLNSDHITVTDLDISGFQKSGLLVYVSSNVAVSRVYTHDNGSAGITVEASQGKKESRNIQIRYCRAENNPGDPTNLNNHSGNGIVAGHCTNLLIEYCTATNNGWDMPRIGNGPVGIWCYESDSAVIQHCLSYRNKTSVGGADGGGFDLDGGVTNSIVQYNLSYENQGSGYCIFQYWGASPWYNNVFRYNISENDGSVSDSRAGIYVWNSSEDAGQFHDCLVYNNSIYNSKEAAISFSDKSARKQFGFYNNIFVGKDSLIKGDKGEDIFLGNDWWSLADQFNADGMHSFPAWAKKFQKEMISGKIAGFNLDPHFREPGKMSLPSFPHPAGAFSEYKIPAKSVLRNRGIDLHRRLNIDTGNRDFGGAAAPEKGIGASF